MKRPADAPAPSPRDAPEGLAAPARPPPGPEDSPRLSTGFGPVSLATLLFAAALFVRAEANVWVVTGAAAAASLGIAWHLHGERLRELLRPSALRLALGVVLGVAMAAATHLLYRLTVGLVPAVSPMVAELYRNIEQDPPGPLLALPVVLVVVLAEECVWRGLLVDALWSRVGAAATLLLATAAYSLPQLAARSLPLVAAALGCGLVWTAIRLWRREILTPLVTHLVWDVLIFVAVPLV